MNTTPRLQALQDRIAPLREQLVNHPVYASIQTLDALHTFMEHHVFAVWDFMSLLKALQRRLTCVELPWIPVQDAEVCYLINEIVTGEESDEDPEGGRISHFNLYRRAMQRAGADTTAIDKAMNALMISASWEEALKEAKAPEVAIAFCENTFATVFSEKPYLQAAVFTFGREDLIPGMFIRFVRELGQREPERIGVFQYYLERHIEVDGDHHSQLAYRMTEALCGDDAERWDEAAVAVESALKARIALWDAILEKNTQAA